MGNRGRLILVAAVVLASCKRSPPPPAPDAAPPDRLGPMEFPEGKDAAFGLQLPRGARITYQYAANVTAFTPLSPEQLSNYVTARIRGGTVARGSTTTIFDKVVATKEPTRLLWIEVRPAYDGGLSQIVVRDVSPPPLDPKMSEEERWRRVGLTPDGKQIDRANLQ